jgi:flavin reductase (DIM6/NTAB) family NADH-FMN oxidoreductase RutF
MPTEDADKVISLATDRPIWDRVFGVFPLVIVGSKEEDGRYNLAPKHLAMPLGWGNHFGFVCSPEHTTYHNTRRHGAFTVGYPRPSEVLLASLAAAPRCEDRSKPSLLVLPIFRAGWVDGVLVEGYYLYLECELRGVIDGFGQNSLIVGELVGAAAHEDAFRDAE